MNRETDFEQLVELHYPALYRFALSLTRQEAAACDLTQQTFLIWASKGHQLQDFSKAKAWLFTTLHREFLRFFRGAARYPEVSWEDAEPELPNIPPASLSGLDGASAVAALHQLDPPFRTAVALFYLEDYNYAEIGEILEIPIGTVKSRISRGIAQLQQLFQNADSTLTRKDPRE